MTKEIAPHSSHEPAESANSSPGHLPFVSKFSLSAGALASTVTLAIGLGGTRSASGQEAMPVSAQPGTPAALAIRTNKLVSDTAKAWAQHQQADGHFVDPVQGRVSTYGEPMLAQAIIDIGLETGDSSLISAGIKAELAHTNTPDNKGFNIGFEVLGTASGYASNEDYLADNREWQVAAPHIQDFLKKRAGFSVGKSKGGTVEKCFSNPNCYNNLKLVRAYADIELTSAGINTTNDGNTASSKGISADVRNALQQAGRNTSSNAKRQGQQLSFSGAGILSDPTRNPLAYNSLSSMMLGQAIEQLGPGYTPTAAKKAFEQSARSLVGLMAPDGDAAYIGRGQGQVWNVAASADALVTAAHLTTNPVWRGRFLSAAERAIHRLETTFTPGADGMPLTPRLLGNTKPEYAGIDSYANTLEYNGLALFALKHAVDVLLATPPANAQKTGADVNGTFVDPSNTRFATIKEGGIWAAVHGSDTHTDARYDFGLVAAQKQSPDGSWHEVLPYRPRTLEKTSAGPVIIENDRQLLPLGNQIQADGKKIVVTGGWGTKPNSDPSIDKGTVWTFKPDRDSVEMNFKSSKDRKYRFQIWFQEGTHVIKGKNTVEVMEPNGRHTIYSSNKKFSTQSARKVYHSAYDKNLRSLYMTIKSKKHDNIIYKTLFK